MTKTQKKAIYLRVLLSAVIGLLYVLYKNVIPTYKALAAENVQRGGGTPNKLILRQTFIQSNFTPFSQTRLFGYLKILLLFTIIIFVILTLIKRFTKRK